MEQNTSWMYWSFAVSLTKSLIFQTLSKSIPYVAAKAILFNVSQAGTLTALNPTVVGQLSKSNNASETLHNLSTQLPLWFNSIPLYLLSRNAPTCAYTLQPEGFLHVDLLWLIPHHLQVLYCHVLRSDKSMWPLYLNLQLHTHSTPLPEIPDSFSMLSFCFPQHSPLWHCIIEYVLCSLCAVPIRM